MAHYQLKSLDLSTRVDLAVRMLNPQRTRGEVSQLAQSYGTSRKFLYELRDRARPVLEQVFQPERPGPKAAPRCVRIDQPYLERAALILSLLPPSLRNVQLAQSLLFGRHCSLGHLVRTLHRAGERAEAQNQQLQPPQPILGEADEIYQAHRPCFTLLDGRSLLLLHLTAQSACDPTTWGVTLLDLQQRGVELADLALDGGQVLHSAIAEAHLDCPLRPDLFHLYQTGRQIRAKLNWRAAQADKKVQQAQRAAQEAQRGKRLAGRPRATPVGLSLTEAQTQAEAARQQHRLWSWLFDELRQTLCYTQPNGQLHDPQRVAQELDLLLEWMASLADADVLGFVRNLNRLRPQLLAPLQELSQRLAPWCQNLDPEWEALIVWAYQQRQSAHIQLERDFPPVLWPTVLAFWDALAHLHRASSHAEGLHSWLRPFLVLHRGRPAWLLSLLQAFWNQHPFQRGKRQGQSPLALAGLEAAPSLNDWISQLLVTPSQPAVLPATIC